MNSWEKITTKIIKAIDELPTETKEDEINKIAILVYMYKSLESPEIFNNNCEILNEAHYDEIRLKRFGK